MTLGHTRMTKGAAHATKAAAIAAAIMRATAKGFVVDHQELNWFTTEQRNGIDL